MQDAMLSIYGTEVAVRMLPVSLADGDMAVDGYTGAPELNRRNRSYTTLLVNRRWVYDRSIYYAIEQAYQGSLPDRRFPFAVINISVPAEQVDVNSHPTKQEVRFRNGDRLFSLVQRAVREALIAHAPVRTATRSFTPVDARSTAIAILRNSAPCRPPAERHREPMASRYPPRRWRQRKGRCATCWQICVSSVRSVRPTSWRRVDPACTSSTSMLPTNVWSSIRSASAGKATSDLRNPCLPP